MNVNLQSFASNVSFYFENNLLNTLTARQKIIGLIAAAALALFVAIYAVSRSLSKRTVETPPVEKEVKEIKPEEAPKKVENQPDPFEDFKPAETRVINGVTYEGVFLNDKLVGLGRVTLANGEQRIGPFKEGVLDGVGRITKPGIGVFIGNIKGIYLNGEGEIRLTDGQVEKGIYINNLLSEGKITYLNGNYVEGKFIDAELCKGTIKTNEGLFEGEFAHYMLNGKGRENRKGVIKEGIFEDGVLVKEQKVFPL